MGFRFYNNRWMDDNEYRNTLDTEGFMFRVALAWILPIGIIAYITLQIFDSQKIAFIAGCVAFVICCFISDFLYILADWIGIVFNWLLAAGIVSIVLFVLYKIFVSLPS
jgi:hypothetical protein